MTDGEIIDLADRLEGVKDNGNWKQLITKAVVFLLRRMAGQQ